jgi:hypothetical protein
MKETNSNSRVPESKLKELTEAAQISQLNTKSPGQT